VLTPAAFLALGGNEVDRAPDPATQGPKPTLAPTPRGDVTLDTDSPRGDDALDWSHPSLAGSSVPHDALPEKTDTVARLGDRWVAGRDAALNRTIVLFEADGTVVKEVEANDF